ncbi:60S ribosomal protein L13 [Wickerhamiella sorbophila]|uniref:60S ribosomal protein L13 n=1 Tax=Wickerhamiella sorbophila TaxID=45607 RepID=A0A2T0FM41_9ASCO|nr:60S ribosomal protein L13 [Wickerhamiella sorbophila]PRT56063.1 60S ribosomal protein L13 [Wickerhamiella sorbophila]
MAISKNNPILKNHFRKNWQERVKTHFDQAGKKVSRRNARAKKAAAVAPRPLDLLRPVVRCPTLRYNRKTRAGRGFSLDELKAAGIPRNYARTVGIAVDHRRQNRSVEGFELNVARLKDYKARLIVFPRKAGKPKKGDASKADIEAATQVTISAAFPIVKETIEITTAPVSSVQTTDAYRTLRLARSEARYAGAKAARAKAKAEAEK